jgi:hypothetical protein
MFVHPSATVMELVEVKAVGCMTFRVDHLRPKPVRGLVLINHSSCHLYKSAVLLLTAPFCWSVGGRKLMLDAFFI